MDWIKADWPAPAQVAAFTTTRGGGVSASPFDSFNLAAHVGDDAALVAANRATLQRACPGLGAISWITQVHGAQVVDADAAHEPEADAQWTDAQGLGCAVLTADCLPLLLCDFDGTVVAAAHAGWRGLAGGVVERTVATLPVSPSVLMAWLGPAIGPARFEVGEEVRAAFVDAAPAAVAAATASAFSPAERPGRWQADLYALTRLRLAAAGVTSVHGGGRCTYDESDRFYSYRRDRITGRMATLIYRVPESDQRW